MGGLQPQMTSLTLTELRQALRDGSTTSVAATQAILDRIVALDGMEITNIYDYMSRLKKLEAGQIITVDVIRDGERTVLLVQL